MRQRGRILQGQLVERETSFQPYLLLHDLVQDPVAPSRSAVEIDAAMQTLIRLHEVVVPVVPPIPGSAEIKGPPPGLDARDLVDHAPPCERAGRRRLAVEPHLNLFSDELAHQSHSTLSTGYHVFAVHSADNKVPILRLL